METDSVIDVSFSLSRSTMESLAQSRDAKRALHEFLVVIMEKIIDTCGQYVPKPMNEFVFHSPHLIKNRECAICLDPIQLYSVIKSPPCKHGFHSSCMDSVLGHGFRHCPICRAHL